MRKNRGITLIALIITIIIMLILVAVSISVALNTGLFKSASDATKNWKSAQEEESKMPIEIGGKKYDSIEDYLSGKEKVEWDYILADATANPNKYKHPDQSSTNGDIGIGTDGKPVNLDLWTYRTEDENSKEIILNAISGSAPSAAGYQNSNIVNGKIQGTVPQYIKKDGNSEFYPVTDMSSTFVLCEALIEAPIIPTSVTKMSDTFFSCWNLMTAPEIPENVTDMYQTFRICTNLKTAPEIPSTVTNMYYTFENCTSLTTAPEIPANVTNMERTFGRCSSLQGTIKINANPTYYDWCFKDAATQGTGLIVTGESTMLDELINTKSAESNITKGQ